MTNSKSVVQFVRIQQFSGFLRQTSNLYTLFFPDREPETEKREDLAEQTRPEERNAEEQAKVANSIGVQQDMKLEAGQMLVFRTGKYTEGSGGC